MYEQLTINMFLADDAVPEVHRRPSGNDYYSCPKCGRCIGLYDNQAKRFTYKRDNCTQCGYIWRS